ncbi:MAG: GIY-YIG nuclease family protein [Patescibacteria group bacterium]
MYSVYALYNKDSGKIYIGQTNNLKERLKLHDKKSFSKSYTSKNKGEWILIYEEPAIDRNTALKREKQLKSYRGRQFIKTHIPI